MEHCSLGARGDNFVVQFSGVSFLYNANVIMNSKLPFLLPSSILTKSFPFRIHHCSISMVLSLFLKTTYSSLCNPFSNNSAKLLKMCTNSKSSDLRSDG